MEKVKLYLQYVVRVPNLQLLETNLTFFVLLRFEICLHLDIFLNIKIILE